MKTIRITEEVHGKLAHLAYKESEMSFKSKKCTKCKKTRVGMYRIIYFIDESKKKRLKLSILVLEKIFIKNWIEVILIISIKMK